MSYSCMSIQRAGWLPLKSNPAGGGDGTRKAVRCCPWPGSDTTKKAALLKANTSENATLQKMKTPEEGQRRLPPGPSPLHLIGLLPYLIRSMPYHYALTDLSNTYGPLLHFKVGQLSMVVVSSPELAKEVLKTYDVACANRPKTMANEVLSYGYTDIVTCPYGEYLKQMRSVCVLELLSAKKVRSFEHVREEESALLLEQIGSSRGAPINLTGKITGFMNSITCRAVFGMDRANTVILIRELMSTGGSLELADLFPSLGLLKHVTWKAHRVFKMKRELEKTFDYVIDEHRNNLAATGKGYGEEGDEDFVDVLLRLKEIGGLPFPLTDDNVRAVVWNMVAGGIESSSSAVEWTMAELVRNPRVMAKAQAEIRQAFRGRETIQESEIGNLSYLKLVVKESMRLHPPNGIIPRWCSEDVEIDGYHIPKNTAIAINLWWLARDPMHWTEPEKFEPERFEESSVDFVGNHFEYIPFGAGKRICPGIAFAVANVEFVLAQLLYYFDWELPPGITAEDMDMTEYGGFAVSKRNSLDLIATPYAPAFVE